MEIKRLKRSDHLVSAASELMSYCRRRSKLIQISRGQQQEVARARAPPKPEVEFVELNDKQVNQSPCPASVSNVTSSSTLQIKSKSSAMSNAKHQQDNDLGEAKKYNCLSSLSPQKDYNITYNMEANSQVSSHSPFSFFSQLKTSLSAKPLNRKSEVKQNKTSNKSSMNFNFGFAILLAIIFLTLTDWRLPENGTTQFNRNQHNLGSLKLRPTTSTKILEETIRTHLQTLWLSLSDLLAPTRRMLARRSVLLAEAQYRPDWPSKALQQEIFLLNLEDGYFGCQVNESQDFLQLFELSRLCDGQPQCYLGTDEMNTPLKCNNRERCGTFVNSRGQKEIIQCANGVCLDGLCYCNDGFGGKSCDIPDENECKYRPCDVFAHCTNTMGSYYCSCFPGKFFYSSSPSPLNHHEN